MFSALEIFLVMHYINLLFTYLLTYLLTIINQSINQSVFISGNAAHMAMNSSQGLFVYCSGTTVNGAYWRP